MSGLSRPVITSSSVVLPSPLRPTMPIRSPARDAEGDVGEQRADAVGLGDPLQVEQVRHQCRPSARASRARHDLAALATLERPGCRAPPPAMHTPDTPSALPTRRSVDVAPATGPGRSAEHSRRPAADDVRRPGRGRRGRRPDPSSTASAPASVSRSRVTAGPGAAGGPRPAGRCAGHASDRRGSRGRSPLRCRPVRSRCRGRRRTRRRPPASTGPSSSGTTTHHQRRASSATGVTTSPRPVPTRGAADERERHVAAELGGQREQVVVGRLQRTTAGRARPARRPRRPSRRPARRRPGCPCRCAGRAAWSMPWCAASSRPARSAMLRRRGVRRRRRRRRDSGRATDHASASVTVTSS